MVTNSVIVVHLSDRQSQSLNHFYHNKMLHTFFHLKHSSHLNTTNCLITFYTLNLSLDLKGFFYPFFKFYHVFIEIINWKFTFFPRIWLFKCKLYYCHITYDLIVWNIKKNILLLITKLAKLSKWNFISICVPRAWKRSDWSTNQTMTDIASL